MRSKKIIFAARKIFSPAGRAEGADQTPIKKTVHKRDGTTHAAPAGHLSLGANKFFHQALAPINFSSRGWFFLLQ